MTIYSPVSRPPNRTRKTVRVYDDQPRAVRSREYMHTAEDARPAIGRDTDQTVITNGRRRVTRSPRRTKIVSSVVRGDGRRSGASRSRRARRAAVRR